ncbi:uncharacterized protein PHACADRAFT_254706 [Phanerochaete carnosa HHB-10118-sp]|uniref:Uncharacterized protein n=1 Tax=Phanerochaete carnosa (strain HHB-10118-sp) TaxID=650164 RepID=K5V3H2_PHACS|nr:uncharacterized protein PHACADRAFT_254706 [Phanerochaete carnosa HHB-10118-sp]EKM57126.1 hypothetical protein PHACADRAFT_254706 [Phanerochaete carnosa HHB-10118-sp]
MDGCSIALVHHGKKTEMRSNCKYHYDFNMGSAKSSSATTPCTNVPLHCPLCPPNPKTGLIPAYWKYNIDTHISNEHSAAFAAPDRQPNETEQNLPGPSHHLGHKLSSSAQLDKHISRLELTRLGVPSDLVTNWRQATDIPNTSDIEPDSDDGGTRAGGKGKAVSRGSRPRAGQKRLGLKSAGALEMPQAKRSKKQ